MKKQLLAVALLGAASLAQAVSYQEAEIINRFCFENTKFAASIQHQERTGGTVDEAYIKRAIAAPFGAIFERMVKNVRADTVGDLEATARLNYAMCLDNAHSVLMAAKSKIRTPIEDLR